MKRTISVLLCGLLLALCVGCGQTGAAAGRAAGASSPASNDLTPQTSTFQTPQDAATSSAVTNLNPAPNATVVESQLCYDNAYCFRPEQDGTYHFCAQTADSFQGSPLGYQEDTITWTIYVLDEPFEDGWQQLSQTVHPAVNNLNGSTDLALQAEQYVYCVCSLNASTSNFAQDGAGALSITPTGTDYAPSSANNYQLAITINSESHIDLDGDGTQDTIYYSVSPNVPDSNGIYTGAKPSSLTVNGVEFLRPEQENPSADFGFWMENPDAVDYYYIVDLDTNDSARELAIADAGSNGDLTTHFFRYDQGKLSYLGAISSLPDEHTTLFHGNGTVSAMTQLNVMQNWSGLRTYQLSDGKIQLLEPEYCPPQLPDGWKVTLLQSLTVYSIPDLSSQQQVLKPTAFALTFPLTDGEHWVEILCADGTSGWAYFPESDQVQSGDQILNASQVFGNLHQAG